MKAKIKEFLLIGASYVLGMLVVILVVFVGLGHCQSLNSTPVAVNQSGVPLASTLVTVCNTNPGTGACGSLVTIYTDITLSTVCVGSQQLLNNQSSPSVGSGCSNPGHTDNLGNVLAYAPAGAYWCQYSGPTITTYSAPCPSSANSVSTNATKPPLPGDIIRFNVNGDNLWDGVGYQQLGDGVFACNTNVSCAAGMFQGNAPVGCCSESVGTVNPAAATPYQQTTYSAGAVGSTSTVIGILHSQSGNTGLFFVRGFWRMSHKLSITAVANNRYWWGLGVWNNGSSLGTNGTNLIGTTAFAADSPNHTFIGWRWSATTDTNFKCLAIQAGGSPTTVVVDSGVAGDSNLHAYDVTLDPANTTYSFYLDGNKVCTIAASTLTFSPAAAGDAMASVFFTGDNKNTATAVSLTFASMFINMRQ